MPQLSIVIPLFNEEKGVRDLFAALNVLSRHLPRRTEVILVNDGSTDLTQVELEKGLLKLEKKIIQFSRNFGTQAAILAGLEHAQGEVVVTMDADLQHPPSMIKKMLQEHQAGIDIVLTKRTYPDDTRSLWKKMSTRLFYSMLDVLSLHVIDAEISDFMSVNRAALTALLSLPERQRFIRGLIQWVGFRTVVLEFEVGRRAKGTTKYSFFRLLVLSLHSLTSFTVAPLYLAGVFGVILFVAACVYAMYVIYVRLVVGTISGWASLLFVLLVLSAFLSMFLGLIGVYIAAMFTEIKHRPIYIVQSRKKRRKHT